MKVNLYTEINPDTCINQSILQFNMLVLISSETELNYIQYVISICLKIQCTRYKAA